MPIYEYRCGNCGLKFELMRPLSQAGEPADCPSCHTPANRVMSLFAAFTKGKEGSNPIGGSTCSSCSLPSCPPTCR